MNLDFRASQFDVILAAGPNLPFWPARGAVTLSKLLTKHGLKVGWIGGEGLRAIGMVPKTPAGCIVLAEDSQKRVHRIESRAIVRFSRPAEIPMPFQGSTGSRVILGTKWNALGYEADWVRKKTPIAILGSGNGAFSLAIRLLELAPRSPVTIIETSGAWEGKRYSGWEVMKRRFESLGGRAIEGTPVALDESRGELTEFRVRDSRGVRIIEVSRVIAVGPFNTHEGYKEFPPGSLRFDLEQTSLKGSADDSAAHLAEESLSHLLGVKIIRALATDLGKSKTELERIHRRAKNTWKSLKNHLDSPFEFQYQGKFLSRPSTQVLHQHPGTPNLESDSRAVASIECIENISCRTCESACPEKAIRIDRGDTPSFLLQDLCTGCGACLDVCPASIPVLLQTNPQSSQAKLTLSWRTPDQKPARGDTLELRNRRGDSLGTGRVTESQLDRKRVTLEMGEHLIWEARAALVPKTAADAQVERTPWTDSEQFLASKTEIFINGEKRLVETGSTVSRALFKTGISRPGDQLDCTDGSCGRCEIEIDGIRKLACQTEIRKGMALKRDDAKSTGAYLCPCIGLTTETFLDKVRQSKISSPGLALEQTGCGSGICHGQLCVGNALALLREEGVAFARYVDWRFPWMDWKLDPGRRR